MEQKSSPWFDVKRSMIPWSTLQPWAGRTWFDLCPAHCMGQKNLDIGGSGFTNW